LVLVAVCVAGASEVEGTKPVSSAVKGEGDAPRSAETSALVCAAVLLARSFGSALPFLSASISGIA